MKIFIRIIGSIVGLSMLIMGGCLIIQPVNDTLLEILNAVTFVLLGLVFVYYGVTGKSKLFIKRQSKNE